MRYLSGVLTLLALVTVGCESPEKQEPPTTQSAVATPANDGDHQASATAHVSAAPMDVAGDLDSTWTYMVQKYDVDRDGRIVRAEYGRADITFDRLDRNGDNAITPDDLAGGAGGGRESMMRGMRAQMIVARYFQNDEQNNRMPVIELQRAVATYDQDGNGVIVEEEFLAIAEDQRVETPSDASPMMQRMLEDVDPWKTLVESADQDGDGALSEEEMLLFFRSRDDGDMVWALRSPGGRGGGSDPAAMSGPAEGEWAPDFTLRPPDGQFPVQLSAFRGNLPVALIFGSYT